MRTSWTDVEAETIAHLQAMIRFDTTNPPGNELPLAEHIVGVLEKEGITTRLLIPAPGRAAGAIRYR